MHYETWEPEESEEQRVYRETGRYPDSWVHERNNLYYGELGPNDDTDRPIWGRDELGNKICVGFEQRESGRQGALGGSLGVTMAICCVIGVGLFICLFTIIGGPTG